MSLRINYLVECKPVYDQKNGRQCGSLLVRRKGDPLLDQEVTHSYLLMLGGMIPIELSKMIDVNKILVGYGVVLKKPKYKQRSIPSVKEIGDMIKIAKEAKSDDPVFPEDTTIENHEEEKRMP